jgi:hypothetical protein
MDESEIGEEKKIQKQDEENKQTLKKLKKRSINFNQQSLISILSISNQGGSMKTL